MHHADDTRRWCIFNAPYEALRSPHHPLVPAKAGIQSGLFRCVWPWVPAYAGMSGTMNWLRWDWIPAFAGSA